MFLFSELALIFTLCLIGEVIAYLLPFAFPSSVIALVLLIVLLLTGIVKERHIGTIAPFFTSNITVCFLPATIGIMQYFDLIVPQLIPFLVITILTTPLVYFATAWSTQIAMKLCQKGDSHV